MANTEYLLQMKNIVKTFPGVRALDGAAITVKPGEVVALCGENGAGKSTTMNILTGYLSSTEGTAVINGTDILNNGDLVEFGSYPQTEITDSNKS